MHQHYRNYLSQQCRQRGMTLSEVQLDRLMQYLELLLHWRRYLNLTGLREAERIIDVLVVESLDFLQGGLLPPTARLLDLGTGAGVPGVTLAICEPALRLTLLDRSQKKMTFVRRVVSLLQLHNCCLDVASAQELALRLAPEERFEVVVARGVGRVARVRTGKMHCSLNLRKLVEDLEIRLIANLEDLLENVSEVAHRLMIVYGEQKFNFFHKIPRHAGRKS